MVIAIKVGIINKNRRKTNLSILNSLNVTTWLSKGAVAIYHALEILSNFICVKSWVWKSECRLGWVDKIKRGEKDIFPPNLAIAFCFLLLNEPVRCYGMIVLHTEKARTSYVSKPVRNHRVCRFSRSSNPGKEPEGFVVYFEYLPGHFISLRLVRLL